MFKVNASKKPLTLFQPWLEAGRTWPGRQTLDADGLPFDGGPSMEGDGDPSGSFSRRTEEEDEEEEDDNVSAILGRGKNGNGLRRADLSAEDDDEAMPDERPAFRNWPRSPYSQGYDSGNLSNHYSHAPSRRPPRAFENEHRF